jgi:HSP20 family molecular chaperone IbpA
MYCQNCGTDVEEEWRYCPKCGAGLAKRHEILERFPSLSPSQDFLEDIEREFRRMNRLFRRMEPSRRSLEEFFKEPSWEGGGISIHVSSETGKEPKVEVRAFGDLKGQEREIMRRLGIGEAAPGPGEKREEEGKQRPIPKVTEEPETKVQRVGDRILFHIKVPGVESLEDVEIQKLTESIEVRAYTEGKAYFTLLSIPRDIRILDTKLEYGILTIEMGP